MKIAICLAQKSVILCVMRFFSKKYLKSSNAGRLTKEEHAVLVDMPTSLMKPKDILTALKKWDPEKVNMKTIYNSRKVNKIETNCQMIANEKFVTRTQLYWAL